jgi:hypothetical protein
MRRNQPTKGNKKTKGRTTMKTKHYDIESAHGAAVELNPYGDGVGWGWHNLFCRTLGDVRKELANCILAQLDREDRGTEYEREWESLAERAATAEVGEVLVFDERGWRIVEREEELEDEEDDEVADEQS